MKTNLSIYVGYEELLGLAAEMVWDRVFANNRLKTIYSEIDDALDRNDEEAFMRLTEELKVLKEDLHE